MSDNIRDLTGQNRSTADLHKELEKVRQQTTLPTRNGGNGGGGNMFEKRLDRLDRKVDQIDGRLSSIEVTLATINAKLDSKPGIWAILGMNVTLIALVLGALSFAASTL